MKLKPLMNDGDVYEKIASNKINSLTEVEKNSNVVKSYRHIFKYLENLSKTYSLSEIKDSLNDLYLVDFPLGEKDNAHQIYESINAKGYKLLSVDLIRNFILMNSINVEKEMIFENYLLPIENKYNDNRKLEKFFRFFIINRTRGFVSQNNVYNEFQSWFNSRSKTKSIIEIMEEIKMFANYYLDIYENNIEYLNVEIKEKVKEFRTITSDMPAPFMLEIYDLFKKNIIKSKEFNEITSIIISYIVRRGIIGLDTSAISRFFTTLIKNVMDVKEENNVELIEAVKIAIINKNINLGARFPTNSELKEQLRTSNVYVYKDALKWIFDKIENLDNPIPIDTRRLQIEHLLPQSEKKWIEELGISSEEYEKQMNRLGNLTLASARDNAAMSNNLFEYKKAILEKTNHLRINTKIYNLDSWNINEIDKRNEELINSIIRLYPYSISSSEGSKKIINEKQKLPKMKELFDLGILNYGTEIYLTVNPDNSKAILLDDKYVQFNNEKMSINEWGKSVTGWTSIRIYSYVCIVGETETLHDKRFKIIKF